MKIWEILKKENIGKTYVSDYGEEYVSRIEDKDCIVLYSPKYRFCLEETYYLSEILKMNFEEAEPEPIDWSKVKIDTKILVSENGTNWHKRYFAKYEHGKVNAFSGGMTSWNAAIYNPWNYAKLWQEGEQ